MTPRRLIRWKSFWFGILVLGFLGWLWMRFIDQPRDYTYWDANHRVTSFQGDSGGFRVYSSQAVEDNGPLSESSFINVEVVTIPVWAFLPKALSREVTCWLAFPLWFPLLFFLISWSGLLAWRWRRQRILKDSHDAAPAH